MDSTRDVFVVRRTDGVRSPALLVGRAWIRIAARLHVVALLSLVLLGCAPKGPPISVVTASFRLDGKPLTEGRVCFISSSGYGAAAQPGPDGQVRLVSQFGDGIPLGDYKVTVGPHLDARDILKIMPSADPKSPPPAAAPAVSAIPEKYWYPGTTDLSATVTAEQHHFTFELETPEKRP